MWKCEILVGVAKTGQKELLSCVDELIDIIDKCRTRQLHTFYVPSQRTKYSQYAPINRFIHLVNSFKIDLFFETNTASSDVYLNNLIN